MKLFIASDHAGFEAKKYLVSKLSSSYEVVDLGPSDAHRVDYPLFAQKLCESLKPELNHAKGILLCGSGIGVSIVANRFKFIRAALCRSEEDVKLARAHNDANVLCLGARVQSPESLLSFCELFVTSPFEGGRHEERVKIFDSWGRD